MIRTRFAPSPTGVLHIGSVRTALFCWLYARHHQGDFILRIEDTDRERSTDASVAAILDGMAWLGLDADEGPVYQTDRMARYKEVIDQWLASKHAYHCYCTREELDALREEQRTRGLKTRYDGRCRSRTEPRPDISPVVRFRNPDEGSVIVDDEVKGRVEFNNSELDDLIIQRSDGTPTYNFCVVVDDSDMRISHVIRGDDHLNNTPRQINMINVLGANVPRYAHLPMILGEDGARLSKRHGAVNILDYQEQGYLPEALLNYLVRLGWSHGDQEEFSIAELIELFDLSGVNKASSSFNPEKLDWLNQQHMLKKPAKDLISALKQQFAVLNVDVSAGPDLEVLIDVFRERAKTLQELAISSQFCFTDSQQLDPGAAKKHLRGVTKEPLLAVRAALADASDWSAESLASIVENVAKKLEIGLGKVGQPLRVAITGGGASPGIGDTLALVGKKRSLLRIDQAIEYVERRIAAT